MIRGWLYQDIFLNPLIIDDLEDTTLRPTRLWTIRLWIPRFWTHGTIITGKTTMRYYPLFYDLRDKYIVIVGGQDRARPKVDLLLKTEARIRVIAPSLNTALLRLAERDVIEWQSKRFTEDDLDNATLAYAATGLEDIDRHVAEAARARHIPVNTINTPWLCDFLTPALVDRDPVVVAIGTEGTAPILAREIKAHLDRHLPMQLGSFARFAASLRPRVQERHPNATGRRRFWTGFFNSSIRNIFFADLITAAKNKADAMIDSHAPENMNTENMDTGFVWFVGAGPGDPELLTIKGQRLLQEADILVVDHPLDHRILDYARRDAEQIRVDAQTSRKRISEAPHGTYETGAIMVHHARRGRNIVRLKRDVSSSVTGQDGEVAALNAAGIAHAMVPGVTAPDITAPDITAPDITAQTEAGRSWTASSSCAFKKDASAQDRTALVAMSYQREALIVYETQGKTQ